MTLDKPFTTFAGSYPKGHAFWYANYAIRAFYRNITLNGKPMIKEPPYRYRLYRCWGNPERTSNALFINKLQD